MCSPRSGPSGGVEHAYSRPLAKHENFRPAYDLMLSYGHSICRATFSHEAARMLRCASIWMALGLA